MKPLSGNFASQMRGLILGLIATQLFFAGCGTKNGSQKPEVKNSDTLPLPTPQKLVFGIPEDSLIIENSRIRRNQFIADLLTDRGVPSESILEISRNSKKILDMRRIKAGKELVFYRNADSSATPRVMVYKENPIDEYAFHLKDSLYVEHLTNPVDTVWRTLSGTIKNSLYVTLMDLNANPELVHKLSEIYAWEIDFFHLDMNDQFRLVYDELFVNGNSVGIDRIHAVEFVHRNTAFQAYHYPLDNDEDYFNEHGESLRKAFLKAPLRFSRISSRYSGRRYHPVLKRYKSHLGTDYAAPTGTPIYSVGDGVITEARYAKYNGNYVKIRHNSVYSTQYLHMSKIKRGIRPGKVVKQGEVIGYVGSTGLANGPHCCFRFWKNGYQVNPMREKIPPTKPIPNEQMPEYLSFIKSVRKQLNRVKYPEDKIIFNPQEKVAGTYISPVIRSAEP